MKSNSGITLYYAIFLAVGMLVSGSFNTLSNKLADVTGVGEYDESVQPRKEYTFDHPYVQTLGMFMGEFACLLVFRFLLFRASRDPSLPPVSRGAGAGYSPWLFLLPAFCDLAGTSMMNVGLTYTYASVFQMLRGAVVIFTGIFSVLFLKRKLQTFHWTGMGFVLLGLLCVGLASVVQGGSDASAPNPLLGDILVIAAQVIAASQMVVEEKFLDQYNVNALEAVGWEGFFGMTIISFLLIIFYFIPGLSGAQDPHHFENAIKAFQQIGNNWVLIIAFIGNIISIAFFNFFGLSVTKSMSATTRMVLDSMRTFTIWIVSLLIGWQTFQWLQIIGFVLLLTGTAIYNKLIPIPITFQLREKIISFDYRYIHQFEELKKEEERRERGGGGEGEGEGEEVDGDRMSASNSAVGVNEGGMENGVIIGSHQGVVHSGGEVAIGLHSPLLDEPDDEIYMSQPNTNFQPLQ